MLTTNAATVHNIAYVPPPTQIYAPPPIQCFQQQPCYALREGGRGSRCSGCAQRGHGVGGSGAMPPPILYVGRTGIIPYIPVGVQPPLQQQNACFSNIIKSYTNLNMCLTCRLYMRRICTQVPHAIARNWAIRIWSNYMEYNHVNHSFCRKAMHKTMYPSSFWWCWAVNIDVNSPKIVTQFYELYPIPNQLCIASTHCAKANNNVMIVASNCTNLTHHHANAMPSTWPTRLLTPVLCPFLSWPKPLQKISSWHPNPFISEPAQWHKDNIGTHLWYLHPWIATQISWTYPPWNENGMVAWYIHPLQCR